MLFHGTKRLCQVGEAQQNVYCCRQSGCNLCCILRGSYDMERAKGSEFFFPIPFQSQFAVRLIQNNDPYRKDVWSWDLFHKCVFQSR